MGAEELFGIAVFGELTKRAEPLLNAALAERGVRSPKELSVEEAGKILEDALTRTAIAHFPGTNVKKLKMGIRNFAHKDFGSALREVRSWRDTKFDAFEPASGISAAIVLAGFGIPVAPLDKRDGRQLAPASDNLDEVCATFSKLKTAMVGYESHKAEFYVLATDCLETLRLKLSTDSRLIEVKKLMERSGASLPSANDQRFRHFSALFSRWPADEISTAYFPDPHPERGTVLFTAGWEAEGEAKGVSNNGFMIALKSMVVEVAHDPGRAYWLTEKHIPMAQSRPN